MHLRLLKVNLSHLPINLFQEPKHRRHFEPTCDIYSIEPFILDKISVATDDTVTVETTKTKESNRLHYQWSRIVDQMPFFSIKTFPLLFVVEKSKQTINIVDVRTWEACCRIHMFK